MAKESKVRNSIRTIEFKGRMTTLNVIRIKSDVIADLNQEISDKIRQAPDFFSQLPVLIELDTSTDVSMAELKAMIERNRLALIGMISSRDEEKDQRARDAGLIVFPFNAFGMERSAPQPAQESVSEPVVNQGKTPTLLIKHPIRSGQQVYARGGDLIVLAAVGEGAEVLADGHIHIYGPLRGRALAGVQGDLNARIFCRTLEAELLSIAGTYCINEGIPKELQGACAQISIGSNDLLSIDKL